ncbi:MAG: PVC-type heme-binding CxxCH protein [Verrucomicrobiota bacterium]
MNPSLAWSRDVAWTAAAVVALAMTGTTRGEELKKGNNAAAQPRTPEEQRRSFSLPEGFVIELVASEETGLPKPVTVAFDDSGRLWSVTATEYPRDNDPQAWERPGRDRVVVIDAPHRPGPHRARVFADGLVLPMGVLPQGRGAVVAHGPEIVFLDDRDGDGRADTRTVLLKGFGTQDTHTMPHQLEWLPGGWIAFSQGVLNNGTAITTTGARVNFDRTVVARLRPDGSDLRVIGTGLNNIWSWVQDRGGRVFFHEANDFGYAVVPFEEDTTYPSFIERRVHPDSPYHPPTTPNLNLGGTGFSGLALSDDREGSFPAPWHGLFFVANPITRRINAVAATLGPDGVHRFEQRPDLVASDDEFFRPIAVRFGPDGCLYIVDWYNRIISHNEIARDHPARDKTRGRIWRVRHQGMKRRGVPDVAAARDRSLIRHLQAPGTWEMRAAWHQVVARQPRSLAPTLRRIAGDASRPDDVRIHAWWCMEGLGTWDEALCAGLIQSRNADVRHEAVRALATFRPPMERVFALIQPLSNEPTFRVRNEVLRVLRERATELSDEHWAWVERWRTRPDLSRTVKGWDRSYLAPGGTYEAAFQNLLVQMIQERRAGVVRTSVPSRFTGTVATQPKRAAEEVARLDERVRGWTAAVHAAKNPDLARGKALFDATCAVCHAVRRTDPGFAPGLAGSRNRSTEAILTSVLHPARAVEGVFRQFRVETKGGEVVDGFMGGETAEAVTVRFAGGTSRVIPVTEIARAGYVEGSSAMPEGLMEGWDEGRVTDLIRYVQTLE